MLLQGFGEAELLDEGVSGAGTKLLWVACEDDAGVGASEGEGDEDFGLEGLGGFVDEDVGKGDYFSRALHEGEEAGGGAGGDDDLPREDTAGVVGGEGEEGGLGVPDAVFE